MTAILYDEDGNYLAEGSTSQTEGGPATVTVTVAGNGCQFYQVIGDHSVDAYYYVNNYFIPNIGYRNGYYDTDNYSFLGNPSNVYLDSYYFAGNGPPQIIEDEFIYLGETEAVGSGNCTPPPRVKDYEK